MAAEHTQPVDLVFEGGGVKGVGLAGAYAELHRRGFRPKSVAGTSAGAITAALVAAGYTPDELDEIVFTLPYRSFEDESWEDQVPLIGHELSVLLHKGIYRGDFFLQWIRERLAAKGTTRFGDLVDEDADEPDRRWLLRVIASDVTHRRMLVLPNDAPHLGIDPDELEIAQAVRMSMSIPVFFEPVVHRGGPGDDEHLIVDGGMLSNFPVWLFDCRGRDPRWPTFGLLLVEPDPKVALGHRLGRDDDAGSGSVVGYVKAIAQTMMEAHDRLYVEQANYARTIPIPTLGVATTEFDITPARARALHESGRRAASEFLDRWDFDAYIAEFRRGKEHSRSADVARALEGAEPGGGGPAEG
ncbi:MAG TPA: patatin-like phospholipase family protein [Solirubrobacteraceae bacterium]|nr:patatin-like phospholipase family protein [Solirubrobacteraceae bacterium]